MSNKVSNIITSLSHFLVKVSLMLFNPRQNRRTNCPYNPELRVKWLLISAQNPIRFYMLISFSNLLDF